MSSKKYFGGCEGGASHSNFVIIDSHGAVIAEATGEGTNQWLIGLDECCRRISELANKAKLSAGLDPKVPLACIGLSLSGADSVENQRDVTSKLLTTYPEAAQQCFTCNDALSPLVTATDSGGVVLIAGTGSNCLLLNPSGSASNCGGWGHMLGDQGSAFWIAREAIQIIFEDNDGFSRSPHSTSFLKNAMFEYFNMSDMCGILHHLYPPDNKQINKEFIAKFCAVGVVKGALENDKLSLHVLTTAGRQLGRHVKAVIPKMDAELLNQPGGLRIICVGSVWKSWAYLKQGFLEGIAPETDEEKQLKAISLLQLHPTTKASIGAAAWAAKKANMSIIIDYNKMSETFFMFRF